MPVSTSWLIKASPMPSMSRPSFDAQYSMRPFIWAGQFCVFEQYNPTSPSFLSALAWQTGHSSGTGISIGLSFGFDLSTFMTFGIISAAFLTTTVSFILT